MLALCRMHITITVIELKYFLPSCGISPELLVIAISDTSPILRKWVPNIYIQIQGMSRKRNVSRKKNFVKNQFKLIFAYLTTLAKNVFDGLFNEYLCVLVSFTWHCVPCTFYRIFSINFWAHSPIRHAHAERILPFTKKKGKNWGDAVTKYNSNIMSGIKQISSWIVCKRNEISLRRQAVESASEFVS